MQESDDGLILEKMSRAILFLMSIECRSHIHTFSLSFPLCFSIRFAFWLLSILPSGAANDLFTERIRLFVSLAFFLQSFWLWFFSHSWQHRRAIGLSFVVLLFCCSITSSPSLMFQMLSIVCAEYFSEESKCWRKGSRVAYAVCKHLCSAKKYTHQSDLVSKCPFLAVEAKHMTIRFGGDE